MSTTIWTSGSHQVLRKKDEQQARQQMRRKYRETKIRILPASTHHAVAMDAVRIVKSNVIEKFFDDSGIAHLGELRCIPGFRVSAFGFRADDHMGGDFDRHWAVLSFVAEELAHDFEVL